MATKSNIQIVQETAPGHEGFYYIIGKQANARQDGPFATEQEAITAGKAWIDGEGRGFLTSSARNTDGCKENSGKWKTKHEKVR